MADQSRSEELAKKRRFWQGHMDRWKDSEQTQVEYCRSQNLILHQFVYWKLKFDKEKRPVSFVEVPVGNNLSCLPLPTPLSLVVQGRYRIEICQGFDPETLKQLVFTLDRL